MDKLKCLTCQVTLPSCENQRKHYKSEWHLYNLKRKLNQMKSISEDDFLQIKNKHRLEQQQAMKGQPGQSSIFYCEVCSKSFLNPKAFEQHNSSNKHNQQLLTNKISNRIQQSKNVLKKCDQVFSEEEKTKKAQNEKNAIDDEEFNESDWEEFDEDSQEELESISVQECLFCGHVSNDIESNLSHMSKMHSFFIPDVEYCTDVKGLLKYLGTKIADGRCCLWCSDNGKSFASKKSAQQHMIDVGHTKVNFHNRTESLLEFENFYDYSSSYPDDMKNDKDDDNEEEDEVNLSVLDGDDYQLKLPSGAVIGNRTLFIYYKQKLRPQTGALIAARNKSQNNELLNKVTSVYRSLGWTGQKDRSMAERYARDVRFMNRWSQRMNLKLGQKHNITKQANFRSQIGF